MTNNQNSKYEFHKIFIWQTEVRVRKPKWDNWKYERTERKKNRSTESQG